VSAYAELHCISNFTFLRGASHPQELVDRASLLGYKAIAITDECSVAGVVRAHMAAKLLKLQLLIGAEFRLQCGLKFVAIVIDRHGYGRLCRLISRGRRAAVKGSYRLSREDVAAVGLQQCFILWVPSQQPLKEQAQWLRDCFGTKARIAVELLLEGTDKQRLALLETWGRELGLPLVASGDVHMHVRERRMLQDALTAVRLGIPVSEAGWNLYPNGERYLRERVRLARLYPPQLLAETVAIARSCNFSLDELRYEYPRELVPEGQTPSSHLRNLVEEGIQQRWPEGITPETRASIEKELALIADLRYEPYFLTVQDMVSFARSERILCQGRGSAANSLVCYCLGISAVGPERGAALLFERFISRERNEPPDIDIDFEHDRREEVIQYVYRKYGRERAAIAATVIMYRPRSALRDMARAFGLDPDNSARLSKVMQWWDGSETLPERVREAGFDTEDPVLQRILTLARALVEFPGFPRHLSQHVGGFVISEGILEELVPVENATMPDRTVVQWDKDDLNDLGLLKVDVLALGMLSALRRAFALVNEFRGTQHTLGHLPDGDQQVYEMISRADTIGVFQIESRAQMSMLPRLKPREYYDLVIEVAIVRPGPIQGDMVHPYLRRRAGIEPVEYPSRQVEEVLKRTLGVPIFQEQVMQLAIVAAGFSPGEADRLRRAMGAWKRSGGIEHFKDKLLSGMAANNYSEEFALRIYRQMLGFGEYGFPECIVGSTRVVDADTGKWVTIDEVVTGKVSLQNTLACDDELRLCKRKVNRVLRSGVKPVWRLRTALGHSIEASAEHPFMTMSGWRELGQLRAGDFVATARSVPISGRRRWLRHQILVLADVVMREIQARSNGSAGKNGFRRSVIGRLASVLRSAELSKLSKSDLYWDRIVSIEAIGSQETYDLQIEGDHNFLANHFVVHNSHAASFALLVYDSSWLKHYEPAAFTCALLNSQPMGFYGPAQLVRDARAHGVEVRAVDVQESTYESSLERREDGEPALRLGLRMVKSLSEAGGQRVASARRERRFESVQDLARRAQLDRGDLEALAAAGALSALSGNRHLAYWEVAGTERSLPLAPQSERAGSLEEGRPLLEAPTEGQRIVADYASVGLTLGRHPLALLRPRLARNRLLTAGDLGCVAHGRTVTTAGIVLMRQRPQSAKGVTFLTLEDETGQVNVIVWESVGREQRQAMIESRLLEVQGELQRQEGVMHVIARRLIDRTPLLGELLTRSRDFH
jgi:DNA-directed DNA polymerase III PolC